MLDNEFPPLGGGTGVVNYHLLSEFASYQDVYVDLVTSSRSRSTFEKERFADRIMLYKVPVDNRNIHHSTNRELLRYSWRAMHQCRRMIRDTAYDLSFAFAPVPAGAISFALHRLAKIPYIVSLQGPDVPGFEARYAALYPFLKPILRRIWREASFVTAISGEHRALANRFMPKQEIAVIYNGVDTELFSPPAEGHSSADVRIICVGRLIERKGQDHLLRAFSLIRQEAVV
ncbi:MAG: glycosyltransferase, partial [Bacteroidetes bacterium]|nr:glycosyltransferase [Bacteroidota bacterium]